MICRAFDERRGREGMRKRGRSGILHVVGARFRKAYCVGLHSHGSVNVYNMK